MSAKGTSELAERLAERAARVKATVGYSIVRLSGDAVIRAHGDARLPTASTFKLYLLAALYAADVAGTLSLDERIACQPDDHTRGSGVLKLLAPGINPTLRDYARLMIVISDNVATNIVMRALGGPAGANAAVHALPVTLVGTEIRDYITWQSLAPDAFAVSCPDDFTALLGAIYHQRCSGSPAHDREMYWILRRQSLRSMIPRHIPCSEYAEEFGIAETYRCGNKTGSMPGVRADVGLIETPVHAWAMAVQVHGDPDFNTGDNHPFNLLIADLSKLVFDAWSA